LLDTVGSLLGLSELLNKLLVLKQVDLVVVQTRKNLVFKFEDLLPTLGDGSELLVLLNFELRGLGTDHNA
jgi:hypothetical protein